MILNIHHLERGNDIQLLRQVLFKIFTSLGDDLSQFSGLQKVDKGFLRLVEKGIISTRFFHDVIYIMRDVNPANTQRNFSDLLDGLADVDQRLPSNAEKTRHSDQIRLELLKTVVENDLPGLVVFDRLSRVRDDLQ